MKRLAGCLALTVLVALAPVSLAAGDEPKKATELRLERVSWNPVTCEFSWVVSEGSRNDKGEYVLTGKVKNYKINMDEATMTFRTSTRRFSKEEARRVHTLLNALKLYAEQSTSWWDAGKGEALDKLARATLPAARP